MYSMNHSFNKSCSYLEMLHASFYDVKLIIMLKKVHTVGTSAQASARWQWGAQK